MTPSSHPRSRDQLDVVDTEDDQSAMLHSHSLSRDHIPFVEDDGKYLVSRSPFVPLRPSPNDEQPAADPIPNEDGQQTVTIDGIRVPKSIVDIIDLLTLRISSLEDQLYELEAGQVSEEQPQQPDEPAQAMVLPDYLPEEEGLGGLFHLYEPVEGHYLFYAGLSITIGIAAYEILGRFW